MEENGQERISHRANPEVMVDNGQGSSAKAVATRGASPGMHSTRKRVFVIPIQQDSIIGIDPYLQYSLFLPFWWQFYCGYSAPTSAVTLRVNADN